MHARGTTPWILTVVALLAGCTINPVPEPPSGKPVEPPDVDRVVLAPDPMMAGDDVDVVGGPGAAEAGQQVWVVNLDGSDAPASATVREDGSFDLTVVGFGGDELRMQVRSGDERSEPVDVIVPASEGPALVAVRPLSDCLALDPPLELELPAALSTDPPEAIITVENHCGAPVAIDDIRLRVPSAAFVVDPVSTTIPDGAIEQITVQAFGSEPAESVLLIHVATPQQERRPVTLFGRGGASGVEPTCTQVGGACLSDPMDITFPADCAELGQKTMQASCEAFNKACCVAL